MAWHQFFGNESEPLPDLPHTPEPPTAQAWVDGIVLASVPVLYGAVCLVTRHAWFLNMRRGAGSLLSEWFGRPALALGIIYISLGLIAHFHCFWSSRPVLGSYWEIGEAVSTVSLIGGLSWFIFEVLWVL